MVQAITIAQIKKISAKPKKEYGRRGTAFTFPLWLSLVSIISFRRSSDKNLQHFRLNIDRLASEGMMFTVSYGEQFCAIEKMSETSGAYIAWH